MGQADASVRAGVDTGVRFWVVREIRSLAQIYQPEKWPLAASQLVEHRFAAYAEACAYLRTKGRGYEVVAILPQFDAEAESRPPLLTANPQRLRVVR
jgi:hypothetical protein